MTGQMNYYDVLGLASGAPVDEVLDSYWAKAAVLDPSLLAGAPSAVVAVIDRARKAVEVARHTLTDPVKRPQYDIAIGIVRPGSGLVSNEMPTDPSYAMGGFFDLADPDNYEEALTVLGDWLAPQPAHPHHVMVPDARGLFLNSARRMMELAGLGCHFTQLTKEPLPVEGLVVDQTPTPGERVHPMSAVVVHVWHPSQQVAGTA
jgi:hypothetical protein